MGAVAHDALAGEGAAGEPAAPAAPARWRAFVREHWERSAYQSQDPPGRLDLTAAELFETLCRYRPDEGATLRPRCRFYRGAVMESCDVDTARVLPRSEDGDWSGYDRRMTAYAGGGDYSLVLNDVQTADFRLWDRLREFADPLLAALDGLPAGGVELGMVCGRYAATPFGGVHRDRASFFMFVLEGEKTMLTWPDGTAGVTDPARSDELSARAEALQGRPGAMLYWPSSVWHVGASPEFSLSAHVVLHIVDDPWETILGTLQRDVLKPASPQMIVPRVAPRCDPAQPLPLPDHLAELRGRLAETLTADGSRLGLAEEWLRASSASGVRGAPGPAPIAPLELDANFHADPEHPILVTRTAERRWSCAANGRLFSISARGPGLRRLVERLNRGVAVSGSELVAEQADLPVELALRPADVAKLLKILISWRAVAVQPADVPEAA